MQLRNDNPKTLVTLGLTMTQDEDTGNTGLTMTQDEDTGNTGLTMTQD